MSAFLLSVGRWCARHATRVLAAWALLIAALGGVVATTGVQLDDTFTISGTESMRGLEVLSDRLPQAAGTSEQVLITSSDGQIENHAAVVNAFALRASQIDGVAMVAPPFGDQATGAAPTVAADGTTQGVPTTIGICFAVLFFFKFFGANLMRLYLNFADRKPQTPAENQP